jgi:(2R)-ethylmalonyl-CoA mutase
VIAVSARHVGFDVVYSGIRLSPEDIVQSAVEEGVDLIGASVLSGSHVELAQQITDGLAKHDAGHIHLVVGGIIPSGDVQELEAAGVARVYTPKDFELTKIMSDIVDLAVAHRDGDGD